MIPTDLLLKYKAEKNSFLKDAFVFREGEAARYYFQIELGEVKMSNYSENGKEFIQGIFSSGRCFGEPPLFGDFNYPSNAIAIADATIWLLPKEAFHKLIKDHPEIHFKITANISTRLHYKAIMAQEISHEDPRHRILRLLNYLKTDIYHLTKKYSYKVELTRQQIADLTGLRVETAIRAIKKLEKEGLIKIEKRKIRI